MNRSRRVDIPRYLIFYLTLSSRKVRARRSIRIFFASPEQESAKTSTDLARGGELVPDGARKCVEDLVGVNLTFTLLLSPVYPTSRAPPRTGGRTGEGPAPRVKVSFSKPPDHLSKPPDHQVFSEKPPDHYIFTRKPPDHHPMSDG